MEGCADPAATTDPVALSAALRFVLPFSTHRDARYSAIDIEDGVAFARTAIAVAARSDQGFKALSTRIERAVAPVVRSCLRRLHRGTTRLRSQDGWLVFSDGVVGFALREANPLPTSIHLYHSAPILAEVQFDLPALEKEMRWLDIIMFHEADTIEVVFDAMQNKVSLAIRKSHGRGHTQITPLEFDMPEGQEPLTIHVKRKDFFAAINASILVPHDDNTADCERLTLRVLANARTLEPAAVLAINTRIGGQAVAAFHTVPS
jgi:hypothetical protein